jgi:hypothetical protein
MNLFSDNKRIIKNNFQILVFPVVISTTTTTTTTTTKKIVEQVSVDLCEVYYELDTIIEDEINPMLKSK